MSNQFRLWAMSCAHVGSDIREGRESLADAIRHSERDFDWDVAVNLGDFSGTRTTLEDSEGLEIVRQFSALTKHNREDIYTVAGNHDATHYYEEPTQWWFRKWIDPTGESPEYSKVDPNNMRFGVEGSWERYSFRVGNLLFLMMSDRNDLPPPVGRGDWGGYPAGAVTGETFEWWKSMVEANQDSIIISAHHHMLKDTTVASGAWEGHKKDDEGNWESYYHGYFPDGGPQGSSYLYFLDDKPDAQAFEGYLSKNFSAIDMWLGGHTHTSPDDNHGGKTHIETKWGVNFLNVAALTLHHASNKYRWEGILPDVPLSRLLTFTEGSREVKVQCYLHTSHYAPQGWYEPAERIITLAKKFRGA